jgi:DNA-binding MarR family transcriptional regulator
VIPAEGFNGMPSRSLQVLAAVNDLGAPSVKELAAALVYRHPTVSVAVDNLLRSGHIESVATRDRRERRVCIRAKGRKLLRELYDHQARGSEER